MTSKQLINQLCYEYSTKNYNEEKLKTTHAIKKDLEVLDIIKKWSFIQENYKDGYGKFTQFLCNIHTIGMKEDFEKIKEWLKDE